MEKTIELTDSNGVTKLLAHFESSSKTPTVEYVDVRERTYKEFLHEFINKPTKLSEELKTEYSAWLDTRNTVVQEINKEISEVVESTNDYFRTRLGNQSSLQLGGIMPSKKSGYDKINPVIPINIKVIPQSEFLVEKLVLSDSIKACGNALSEYSRREQEAYEQEKHFLIKKAELDAENTKKIAQEKEEYLKKYVVPFIQFYDVKQGFYVIQPTDNKKDVIALDFKQLKEIFKNLTDLRFNAAYEIDLLNLSGTYHVGSDMEFTTVDQLYSFIGSRFGKLSHLTTTIIAENIMDESKMLYLTCPGSDKILAINRDHADWEFELECAYIIDANTKILDECPTPEVDVVDFSRYLDIGRLRSTFKSNYKKLLEVDPTFAYKFDIKLEEVNGKWTISARLFGKADTIIVGTVDNKELAETIKSQFIANPQSLLKLYNPTPIKNNRPNFSITNFQFDEKEVKLSDLYKNAFVDWRKIGKDLPKND
jgi:hypothetical protein